MKAVADIFKAVLNKNIHLGLSHQNILKNLAADDTEKKFRKSKNRINVSKSISVIISNLLESTDISEIKEERKLK